MALDDLVEEDPRDKEKHCPECGEEGEETERLEVKCTSDDCDVLHWYPVGG